MSAMMPVTTTAMPTATLVPKPKVTAATLSAEIQRIVLVIYNPGYVTCSHVMNNEL